MVVRVEPLQRKTNHRNGALFTHRTILAPSPANSEREPGILGPNVIRQQIQLLLPAQAISVVNGSGRCPCNTIIDFWMRAPGRCVIRRMSRGDVDASQIMQVGKRRTQSGQTKTLLKRRVPVRKVVDVLRLQPVRVEERSEVRLDERDVE